MRLRFLRASLAVSGMAVALLAGGVVQADPIPAGLAIKINGWGSPTGLGCTTTGYVTSCAGSNAGPVSNDFDVLSWNLTLDSDPTVVSFFAIQNNLLSTQTFTINVTVPTSGTFGPPVMITGSVQGGATDANGNGVTLTSSSPTAMYQALVDGVTVQTLLNDPQNYTTGTPYGSVSTGPVNFGPTNLGIAATTDIGITIKFTLSPGDVASFTGVFNLVPEPGTLMLLATGLAGVAHFGRRRRA